MWFGISPVISMNCHVEASSLVHPDVTVLLRAALVLSGAIATFFL